RHWLYRREAPFGVYCRATGRLLPLAR
ncbi:hypothetical protein ECPA23_4382, partial [Escherichia coli PA23]